MTKMNKYNATKVHTDDGLTFDSKREYQWWLTYCDMQQRGEITNLQRQVKYTLIPKNDKYRELSYIADFVFLDSDGVQHIVDVKGMILPEFKLKQKLFYSIYGREIEIVR